MVNKEEIIRIKKDLKYLFSKEKGWRFLVKSKCKGSILSVTILSSPLNFVNEGERKYINHYRIEGYPFSSTLKDIILICNKTLNPFDENLKWIFELIIGSEKNGFKIFNKDLNNDEKYKKDYSEGQDKPLGVIDSLFNNVNIDLSRRI